MVTRVLSHLTA